MDNVLEIPGRKSFSEAVAEQEQPVVEVVDVLEEEQVNPLVEQEDAPKATLAQLTNDKYKTIEDIESLEKELADLKNAPKKTGDEFIDDLHEFIKNGGDPYDYVKASQITVEGLSDLDIVKLKMKLNNDADLTDDEIDEYVRDRYKQYEDPSFYDIDEKKAKLGLAQLKIDAKRDKDDILSFKKKATYKAPEKVEQVADPKIAEEEARIEKELTSAFKSFKGLEFSDENVKVNIPIADKAFMEECVKNPYALFNSFKDKEGNVDYPRFLDAINYLSNPEEYRKIIAKTVFAQGRESQVKEITNPSEIQTTKGELEKRGLTDAEFKAQF